MKFIIGDLHNGSASSFEVDGSGSIPLSPAIYIPKLMVGANRFGYITFKVNKISVTPITLK